MKDYLITVIYVALASAFSVCFLYKVGIMEWLQIHGRKLISEWAKCEYCQSFWASVFYTGILIGITHDISFIAVPILATPICRFLIQ